MKMHSMLIAAASAMAMTAGAVLVAQEAPVGREGRHGGRGHGMMQRADANNDGTITRAEADTAAAQMFVRLDGNNDGRLTTEDRAAAAERASGEMFARVDADGNGSISRAEWDAHHQQRQARRDERRATRQANAGEPGAPAAGGRHHGRHGGHRGDRMAMMAQRADTNHDNAVSREEFMTAASARFARADTNGDGSITSAERQAAHQQMRQQRRATTPAQPAN